jgi:hypothetical protein
LIEQLGETKSQLDVETSKFISQKSIE